MRGRTELVVHLEVTGLNVLRELLKIRAPGGLLPGRDFEHDLHFLKGPTFSFRSQEKHLCKMCQQIDYADIGWHKECDLRELEQHH